MTVKLLMQIFKIVVAMVLMLPTFCIASWQTIKPGLDYKVFQPDEIKPFGSLHVFSFTPKDFQLHFCAHPEQKVTTAFESAIRTNAILAFNGAFFSPFNKPIGLRVDNSKVLNKFKPISWWGVFYLKKGRPNITSAKKFKLTKDIEFAVQAGPRLLINGKTPKLKTGYANRTALGIKKNGQILIVVSKHAPITTSYLSKFFKQTLGAYQALNLDGGRSSQFYINHAQINDKVSAIVGIPDPICLYQGHF